MTMYHGKLQTKNSGQWENVIVSIQTYIETSTTIRVGQLRLDRGRVLLGNEAGELLLDDGARAPIVLNGIIVDLCLSQPLYKFLLTSPFSNA